MLYLLVDGTLYDGTANHLKLPSLYLLELTVATVSGFMSLLSVLRIYNHGEQHVVAVVRSSCIF